MAGEYRFRSFLANQRRVRHTVVSPMFAIGRSFQHFAKPEAVSQNLARWYQRIGKPVLLADHAVNIKSADGSQRHDGAGYAETLRRLRDVPGCVGFHLCGAYLRKWALIELKRPR